jgi:23S rRNA pseudouridine2605 synthase
MGERIQKILANLGYASRREIERWIEAGRVQVNGKIIQPGTRIEPNDRITVDGKAVEMPDIEQVTRVLLYHKPVDEICTRDDPEGRPTVFDHLPQLKSGRWVAIGRLDINSSGLMLFTNNGELANRLMHPRYEVEREYAVRVLGEVTDRMLEQLKKGVKLEDGMARFNTILDAGGQGANHWYHVTLKEGRNREVRRIWEAVDRTVSRLHRIRYGPVALPRSLRQGQSMELDQAATERLLETAGLNITEKPPARAEKKRRPAQRRKTTKKR